MTVERCDAGRREWLVTLQALAGLSCLGLGMSLTAPARAAPADRLALVIGNGGYPTGALKNARADAQLMSGTLQELGFQVRHLQDLTRQAMLDQLFAFLNGAGDSAVRFIYYCGHGAQYRGRNYLLPVDAVLSSEDDLPARAVDGTALIERAANLDKGVNILVFDACRSPPWRVGTRAIAPDRKQGLSPLVAPSGTLVGFSTSPNAVARDMPDRPHSVYTQTLCEELRKPGQAIEAVFKQVRLAVVQASAGQQVPWESSSLVGELCFNRDQALGCAAASERRGSVVHLR